ncbi:Lysosomal Pro-X carboxypeptidase [Eumeta japonica]|uniref:Lysosomal Pro-X carboxypeptidase n=1 Tax=Eumeta variegata TaxID=151549 RepID=A0A4C1YRC0_EUMVA|nr:Lysosomal Pro-X carboxypeptidase [Eumeta japonica]
MLAAYFRIKYPHLVQGAIAASAPIHQFTGMVPCDVFDRIVTSGFRVANTNCASNIRKSWTVIRNFAKNTNNTDWLKTEWKLCDPVKNQTDVDQLVDFLRSIYETLAMVNYPYDCDFLVPLPGNPVRYVCQFLEDGNLTDKNLLKALGQVINTYTNYTGKTHCVNYKAGSDYGNLDASGWDFQACTEMVMPMCSDGVNDMFEPNPWNYTTFAEDCKKKYGISPKPEMARIEYGGDNLKAASNIVFSNGLLDPWTGGGILSNINEDLKAIIIIDSAHHLDLMASNPKDPRSVVVARDIHKANIRKWILDFAQTTTPHMNTLY